MGIFTGSTPIGTVAQLWRYPVKSMAGECLREIALTPQGLDRDRLFAFQSSGAPPGMLRLTSVERRTMLGFQASATDAGVMVRTPAGRGVPVDAPELPGEFASPHVLRLTHSPAPQTDVRPLSLISLQSIGQLRQELGQPLDLRQFRANLYLDLTQLAPASDGSFPEDRLAGRTLAIGGTARIRILERDPRCRFFSLDPGTGEPNPELMKLLHRRHQSRAGLYAATAVPGPLRAGDAVHLL